MSDDDMLHIVLIVSLSPLYTDTSTCLHTYTHTYIHTMKCQLLWKSNNGHQVQQMWSHIDSAITFRNTFNSSYIANWSRKVWKAGDNFPIEKMHIQNKVKVKHSHAHMHEGLHVSISLLFLRIMKIFTYIHTCKCITYEYSKYTKM